jgi:hypothetical protein
MRAAPNKGTLSLVAAAYLICLQPSDRNNLRDPWQTKSKHQKAPVTIGRAAALGCQAKLQNKARRRRSDDQMEPVISGARSSEEDDS